jgi:hypothetical protein
MYVVILFMSCRTVNEPIIPSTQILQELEKEGYVNISAAESMLETQDTIKVNLISYFNPIKLNLPRYNGNLNKLMLSKKLEKLINGDYTYHSGVYEVWFQQTISDSLQDKLEILSNPIILYIDNITAYLISLPMNGSISKTIHFTVESENDVKYKSGTL